MMDDVGAYRAFFVRNEPPQSEFVGSAPKAAPSDASATGLDWDSEAAALARAVAVARQARAAARVIGIRPDVSAKRLDGQPAQQPRRFVAFRVCAPARVLKEPPCVERAVRRNSKRLEVHQRNVSQMLYSSKRAPIHVLNLCSQQHRVARRLD